MLSQIVDTFINSISRKWKKEIEHLADVRSPILVNNLSKWRRAYFSFVVSVVMIYETFNFLGVSQNSLVGPPLFHVPVTVVVSPVVVESVSQFVTKDRADGAVIQRPEIEKSIYRNLLFTIPISIVIPILLKTQFVKRKLKNSCWYSCMHVKKEKRHMHIIVRLY